MNMPHTDALTECHQDLEERTRIRATRDSHQYALRAPDALRAQKGRDFEVDLRHDGKVDRKRFRPQPWRSNPTHNSPKIPREHQVYPCARGPTQPLGTVGVR